MSKPAWIVAAAIFLAGIAAAVIGAPHSWAGMVLSGECSRDPTLAICNQRPNFGGHSERNKIGTSIKALRAR